MANVGFIGGGNMSTAIVNGILKSNAHDPSKIWVSGPHIEHLSHWKELGTNVTTENSVVFNNCNFIFLGIKPAMLKSAIQECYKGQSTQPSSRSSRTEVVIVSMLAGVSISILRQELSCLVQFAPIVIIRIMPNTPIMVGKGITLYTADSSVRPCSTELLVKLLGGSSVCQEATEPLLESLSVLTACGPAFMYMVIEALADGAVKQGAPRALALRFASEMVVGSGHMVLETGKHPGLLKDEVCSPGGSTICGVAALENGNLRASLINAIEAATMRTKSMHNK